MCISACIGVTGRQNSPQCRKPYVNVPILFYSSTTAMKMHSYDSSLKEGWTQTCHHVIKAQFWIAFVHILYGPMLDAVLSNVVFVTPSSGWFRLAVVTAASVLLNQIRWAKMYLVKRAALWRGSALQLGGWGKVIHGVGVLKLMLQFYAVPTKIVGARMSHACIMSAARFCDNQKMEDSYVEMQY